LAKYFTKGKEILAEGRIQTGSYTGQDGKRIYTTEVVLDRVEFCGSKGGATQDAEEVSF
jgi:single-strand DNA-binding protein